MMIKKKQKPQEEENKNINTESTENKDNASTQSDQEMYKTGESFSEQEQQQQCEEKAKNTTKTDKVENDLKETMSKLAEMQDKYIRLSAEFDNYRKRTLREKMDISKYAGEDLLLKIIPVMDDFERALKHMGEASDFMAMKNGIDLIYGKFNEFLRQNGVKEIEALNSDFNFDIHEAVAKVPVTEEDMKGKVVDVTLKGYYLQDKVLRYSKVVVGE